MHSDRSRGHPRSIWTIELMERSSAIILRFVQYLANGSNHVLRCFWFVFFFIKILPLLLIALFSVSLFSINHFFIIKWIQSSVCVIFFQYSSIHIYDWFDGRSDQHNFVVDLCICCYCQRCGHRCFVAHLFWCTQNSRCQNKILLFWWIPAKWNNDLCDGYHCHHCYGTLIFFTLISLKTTLHNTQSEHFD